MGFQATFNERVIPAANRAFGVLATLLHGAVSTVSFTATWEDQENEVFDSEGFPTRVTSRNFMFAIADCASSAGQVIEPRAGDLIRFSENETAVEFELLPIGKLPAVELMDGGYRWRVRTKRST